jgi:hypothetical protein
VNRAEASILGKERARARGVPPGEPHAVLAGGDEQSGVEAQRAHPFLFPGVKRDGPARAAAGAGVAAPVVGVETQTLGHVTSSDIIVILITGSSVGAAGTAS